MRAAWATWVDRGRDLASRRRVVIAAVGAAAALSLGGAALLVARRDARPALAPTSSAAGGVLDIVPACAARPPSEGAEPSRRLSVRMGGAPFAEVLRAANVEPAEVYRLRRSLEAIPGFVGVDGGRLVATRSEQGAFEAFELRTPTWVYRGKSDATGQLVAERTTAPPTVHLCSGVVRWAGALEPSVAASSFEADLAPLVVAALAGRVEVAALAPATELRIVVREVDALGGFGGYDGLAALEVRPPTGAATRVYGVRGDAAVVYVDVDGQAQPSAAPHLSDDALASFRAARPSLDAALDAAAFAPPTATTPDVPSSASAAALGDAPPPEGDGAPPDASLDALEDREPVREDPTRTVAQAAKATCSTRIVAGLSRQIIAEARCLDDDAFARVPARKNLRASSNVFLFLEAPARDHLLRALDAHPERTLTVNSALRTVAQQVLLSKWGETRRCGVKLAATPAESNHESGLALDVQESSQWRKALEAEGFRWMGRKDPVHFDYAGPGAVDHRGLDVRAFQRLWNRNHPDDAVSESGKLDAKTKQRLLKSPAVGFPVGARCGA